MKKTKEASTSSIGAMNQLVGFSSIGGVNTSAKIRKGLKRKVYTYIVYLAPHTMSGYQVCPKATEDCKKHCLFASGLNKFVSPEMITRARINRTKLFFEDRELFMQLLITELTIAKRLAHKEGVRLVVRLNGTSDLSPEQFNFQGKNILQLFPDLQFYDYTKKYKHYRLLDKYPNYDLTFSFSGENWVECEKVLKAGGKVSVVFADSLPPVFMGWPVVSGEEDDLRFLDPKGVVVGLKFKKVREKLDITTQKFVQP